MNKIIIEYPDGMTPKAVMAYIDAATSPGFISTGINGVPQFCHATTFKDGVTVETRTRRTESSPHSFRVWRRNQ